MMLATARTRAAALRIEALLPAAGKATRLGALSAGPKATLPVYRRHPSGRLPLLPAATCALDALSLAGVHAATFLVAEGSGHAEELQRAFGTRHRAPAGVEGPQEGALAPCGGMSTEIGYQACAPTRSATHTLSHGLRSLTSKAAEPELLVALAYPDILFRPVWAFRSLLDAAAQRATAVGPEVVLGCFPTRRAEKTDMVDFDRDGWLREIRIKKPDAGLRYTWQIAVWRSRFTQRLIEHVDAEDAACASRELHVGYVIEAARQSGARVLCVPFPDGRCLDVGTPDDLARAAEF